MRLAGFIFSVLLLSVSCQLVMPQIEKPESRNKQSNVVQKTAEDKNTSNEPPKWVKEEITLRVDYDQSIGWASAKGFWQATSSSRENQLVSPVAVKITCDRDEKSCMEVDASVFVGVLDVDSTAYTISEWTKSGIVADDTDEGPCAIGHRLIIDYKSNSVVVTDYPKKYNVSKDCKPFQSANSYALHGGSWVLYPPPAWDAPGKTEAGRRQ